MYFQEAYRNWLCSSLIPFYADGKRLAPCPLYCERVETRCPYIKPHLLDLYAGEQVFTCRGQYHFVINATLSEYSESA